MDKNSAPKSNNQLCQQYNDGEKVHEEPIIQVIDDFLSESEIAQLVKVGAAGLAPAQVSGKDGGMESKGRSGRNVWIPHDENDIILGLCERLSTLVKLPLKQAESLQLIHYFEAQEYAPHFDAWDATTDTGQRCMKRGGQRLVTCLMYLNDVQAGGDTQFPKLDLIVSAKRARLVIFHNCYPGTTLRHPHSLHGGMPVSQGEKWACNLWFRELDYR